MWNKKSKEEIKEWSELKHLGIIFLGTILSFFMGFYFSIYTDSVMPITDSFTTTFSIIRNLHGGKKSIRKLVILDCN